MINVGGKHSIYNAVSALIEEGDEVIIPAPYWVSFPDIVKLAGGDPVFVPTAAADNFCLNAAQVEAAITPRTRLAIINSPNNPNRRGDSARRVRAHLRGLLEATA